MNWQTWFRVFGSELVSVIPPDADSDTIAKKLRGKCIGTRKADGKWVGTTGPMADRCMTLEEAKIAHRTGAGIGMLGRHFPALDIDVDDEALAADIEKHAFSTLGPAPVRFRAGSPRRLLMYAAVPGLPKERVEFMPSRTPPAKPWAVELLATGQYYNVEGIHPSGVPYQWRGGHPCEWHVLTQIDEKAVKACFQTY